MNCSLILFDDARKTPILTCSGDMPDRISRAETGLRIHSPSGAEIINVDPGRRDILRKHRSVRVCVLRDRTPVASAEFAIE